MVAVIYSILWIIVAIKWGDWKNWKLYYSTMLFAVIGNSLYEIICSEYQLWTMEANGLPNRTIPILLLSLIGMPISTFVYLSHFPYGQSKVRQFLYILFFVLIFAILEVVSVAFGAITYHNGWNLIWSIMFDFIMFTIIVIHYRKPIKALLLSSIVITTLSIIFDVDLGKMK